MSVELPTERVKQVYGEIGRKGGMHGRSVSSPYLSSGLLRCSECGASISIVSGRWRGRSDVVYGCPQNTFRAAGVCTNSVRVFRRALESRLLDGLQEQIMRPKLLEARPDSLRSKLRNIRSFVVKRMQDLRAVLNSDVGHVRAELAKHIDQITLTPTGDAYVASGTWNFVGRGSIDGAGGQNRTGYARLFRAALYQ
jgi:Recombinase zinc beta ribbon domain